MKYKKVPVTILDAFLEQTKCDSSTYPDCRCEQHENRIKELEKRLKQACQKCLALEARLRDSGIDNSGVFDCELCEEYNPFKGKERMRE